MIVRRCVRICVLVILILASRSGLSALPDQWQSPHYATHPLVGQIHDGSGALDWPALLQRMAQSRFILIGEKHDNRDHHEIELRLLRAINDTVKASGQPGPGVVLEMLDESQQPLVDEISTQLAADDELALSAEQLQSELQWPESGWPWQDYGAAISWVINRRLPLRAGNISSSQMKTVYQAGISDQHPTAAKLRAPLQDKVLEQVFDGHCGLLPRQSLASMVDIQLVKDAAMARALVDTTGRKTVLLAGTGHTRVDSGVPRHLALLIEDPPLSIALIEVDPDRRVATDYDALALFDVLIFTPVANQRDYCAELEKSMRK